MKEQDKKQDTPFFKELTAERGLSVAEFKDLEETFVIDRSFFNGMKSLQQFFADAPEPFNKLDDDSQAIKRRDMIVLAGYGTLVDGKFVPKPHLEERYNQFMSYCRAEYAGYIRVLWLSYDELCDDLGVEPIEKAPVSKTFSRMGKKI